MEGYGEVYIELPTGIRLYCFVRAHGADPHVDLGTPFHVDWPEAIMNFDDDILTQIQEIDPRAFDKDAVSSQGPGGISTPSTSEQATAEPDCENYPDDVLLSSALLWARDERRKTTKVGQLNPRRRKTRSTSSSAPDDLLRPSTDVASASLKSTGRAHCAIRKE
jgi:hypothetical protein